MYEVRDGVRHTRLLIRLLIGVALCAALFVFAGCRLVFSGASDGTSVGPSVGPPPDTAPPVITLMGTTVIVLDTGEAFTDPGFAVDDNDPNYTGEVTPTITGTGSAIDTTAAGVYIITYTAPADAADNTPETITRTVRVGADADGNNRIDINFLADLDEVRAGLTDNYELTRDLDFADGDSHTGGTVNLEWRPTDSGGTAIVAPDSATNEGWDPIGTDTDIASFSGSFFGNGFSISNLYARSGRVLGLFGVNSGTIEGVGVVGARIYGGGATDNLIGGLVGQNSSGGTITTSYATGNFVGAGGRDIIGGLVGQNSSGGTITASYATGNVDGGADIDNVGGLVGDNNGTITASYATGNVDGGAGDFIGALFGSTNADTSFDFASYGFGMVMGRSGERSTDASPPATVADACDITQENSSARGADWDAAQWDFGTATERPVVRNEDGTVLPGQDNRGCN